MTRLGSVITDAGGTRAPKDRAAQLRAEVVDAFADGAHELTLARSGYPPAAPVPVAIAAEKTRLLAVAPVAPELRADPDAVPERAWVLTAALVGALVEAAEAMAPADGRDLALTVGSWEGWLAFAFPLTGGDLYEHVEYALEFFPDHLDGVDRLRAAAYGLPAAALGRRRGPAPADRRAAPAADRRGGRPLRRPPGRRRPRSASARRT